MTSAADLTPAPGLRSVMGQLPSFARGVNRQRRHDLREPLCVGGTVNWKSYAA